MPVTTIHSYIDNYTIKQSSTKLIIGTIHPHLVQGFQNDFFYGNVRSFWNILSNAFPKREFSNREQIIETLDNYNVAITDIIRQCDRESEGVVADSELYNLVYNDEQICKGIVNSEIDTIYFTSRFGVNNAARLFVDVFNIDYVFNQLTNEFIITPNYFGKEIRCVVLYSPSNSANIGIARAIPYLNNLEYFKQYPHPVTQFKIEHYREKFDFFDADI